jgi:hypothetical protein
VADRLKGKRGREKVKGKTKRGATHAHQERNPEQMKADERRGQNGRHKRIKPFQFFLYGAAAHIGPWPPLYEVP